MHFEPAGSNPSFPLCPTVYLCQHLLQCFAIVLWDSNCERWCTCSAKLCTFQVERNGDSQFNSGPLGLSQKHALSKEKHNIAQPLRSGVSPRKHAHRHEDQHSGQYPPLGRQPNNVHPRPNEPRSDDVQNESEDGFHRSETKSFQDAPIVLSGPVLELQVCEVSAGDLRSIRRLPAWSWHWKCCFRVTHLMSTLRRRTH